MKVEPLEPVTWFRQIEMLLGDARKLDGEAPDKAIRRAYHLIELAPGPLRDILPQSIEEAALEAMLACGGYESAVMALLGSKVAFRADKEPNVELITVNMTIDENATAGRGEHQRCSVAMLQAWAHCLANIGKAAKALNVTDPDLRKWPDESHRNSTEH